MKRIENYLKERQSSNSSTNIDIKGFQPYIGPRPFNRDPKDQERFFGRDYETDEIVSLISSHKLILIYAQSGAGKTSIFNAQIIPTLEQMGFEVLPVIRLKSSNIIPNLDTDHIKNIYLFNSLQSLKPDLDPNILKDKSLSEFLHEYFPVKRDNKDREIQQILIYDQLEEIFDILPRNWKEQRKEFFKEIAQTLTDIIPLQIVFIIREDYLARLDPYSNILPEKLRPRFRLERLRADSALLAIKGPLKNVPEYIIQNYEGDIDKDINNIIHELLKIQNEYLPGKTRQIEGEFIEPIQLQLVLSKWWGKITNLNNKSVKQNIIYVSDVDTALEEFYEDAINEVINKGKIKESYIRKWCEENLITQSNTRSTVYKSSDSTAGLKNDLIEILEDKYFIKQNHRAGARWCELTHDRLIQPIISSNQKWRKEQQKRTQLKILKISIPMIISIIIIYVIFDTLYFVPPVESFSAGELPFTLSVDQNSGLVYVINPKKDTISVINGKRNDLIKTISVGNEPTDIAIDPKNNLIYTSHPSDKTISVKQRDNFIDVLNPLINQIPIIHGISDYKTKRIIQLDYLPFSLGIDSDHSKLYVTHYYSNNLSVINTNTDEVLKTIKVGNKPTEVYVDSKFNKVYVANQGDNTVSVINGTNDAIIQTIPVGKNPRSIASNPYDNKVYVANQGDNTVSVINETDYHIIQTVTVGKKPISMAFNPYDNKVYVVNQGDNTVSVINGTDDIVKAIFEVGNNPTSININEDQNILYIVNNLDNELKVIDLGHNLMKDIGSLFPGSYRSELVINKIPVGVHPSAIAIDDYDHDHELLYVANSDSDTVSVIDGTKNEIKKQFKVGHKPNDIDVHTKNGTIYVSNSLSDTVTVIDPEKGSIQNISTQGKYPTGLAVNERTNLVYVANTDSNTVSVINGKTMQVSSIKVGNNPIGVAVDEDKDLVYVTNYRDNTISVLNTTGQTNYRVQNIGISKDFSGNEDGPKAIAVDPKNKRIYVANMFSDNISIIDTDRLNVTIVIPAGDSPTDISLGPENIYVTNRNNNVVNILDIAN